MKPTGLVMLGATLFCAPVLADELHDLAYTLGEILAS